MSLPTQPEWWPARQLQRVPIGKVFVCGRRLNPPLYSHVVNFPRLEIPLGGVYKNQIESGDQIVPVSLRPGQALFAAPNCWNVPEWQPGLELLSVLFGRTQLGISLVSARSKGPAQPDVRKFSLPRPLAGSVSYILDALVRLEGENGPPGAFVGLANALVLCLESLLAHPAANSVSRPQTLLEEIRVYLQSHYHYEITRDSVARQFNISPNHLSRLFQTHGQMTFSSYLTHVRIDRAKHLLGSYNLKLDEIAARCGYHDTPYFCHVFKKLTRTTPAEYRQKSRRTPALIQSAEF